MTLTSDQNQVNQAIPRIRSMAVRKDPRSKTTSRRNNSRRLGGPPLVVATLIASPPHNQQGGHSKIKGSEGVPKTLR
jgi:hypothetical protein